VDDNDILQLWWDIQPLTVRERLLSLAPDTALSAVDATVLLHPLIREIAAAEIDSHATVDRNGSNPYEPADPTLYRMSATLLEFLESKRTRAAESQ
jgi:hypothetical protein